MTCKDYQLIADAIGNAAQAANECGQSLEAFPQIVASLSEALASDNPRFDRHRFTSAVEAASGI